ncbi:hypothetical protein GXM_01155 [Nostoc sphaeroides CCNUC1]|uniref:Uncharacterized protein n=1 Tax=Nostoc sphaeroides CCNUC1 TaxID=2653204 RepID=A0A5P8VTH4_9NOSO|nr:hypothetical protein GXM_01155 [Nostoc sphaeroides CCNUC1]
MPFAVTTLEAFIRPQPNVQTLVAGLACICWRHCNHLNSFFDTLVLKEASQLIKRPRIRPSALNFTSRLSISALSNPSQVFNSDNRFGVFGLLNNRNADLMVEPLLKSSLTPRQPLQNLPRTTASRPCAYDMTIQVIWKTSLLFLSSFKERDFEFPPYRYVLGVRGLGFSWTFPHNLNCQISEQATSVMG